MFRPHSLTLTLLTATALVACTADPKGDTEDPGTTNPSMGSTGMTDPTGATDPTESPATEGTTEGTTDPTDTTPTTTETAETAADGEACSQNDDCMSKGCLKFRDADDGECVAAPANSATRIAGTLLDFATSAPVANTELRVIGALSALGDPANATPVAQGTSDAAGKVDFVSPEALKEGIGIIGIVGGGDYYTSATGLASPTAGKYGPMNGIRDIWAVPSASLTEWSGLLAADPDVMMYLPLGDNGGVIGLARDAGTSAPKAGVKVVPVKADSKSFVRYLAEDGQSFTSEATGSSGIFIVVNPGLAEEFTVDGNPEITAKAGSAKGAAFVMILGVP